MILDFQYLGGEWRIANALIDTGLVPICRPVFTNVHLDVKLANDFTAT
jgi:hypothetical protein